jgi:hypothetical protein
METDRTTPDTDESKIELLPQHQGNPDEMVNFGDVARYYMHTQAQYGSHYIDGFDSEYPNLGEGLTFEGDPENYHAVKIRQGDIPKFLARFLEHKRQMDE